MFLQIVDWILWLEDQFSLEKGKLVFMASNIIYFRVYKILSSLLFYQEILCSHRWFWNTLLNSIFDNLKDGEMFRLFTIQLALLLIGQLLFYYVHTLEIWLVLCVFDKQIHFVCLHKHSLGLNMVWIYLVSYS